MSNFSLFFTIIIIIFMSIIKPVYAQYTFEKAISQGIFIAILLVVAMHITLQKFVFKNKNNNNKESEKDKKI